MMSPVTAAGTPQNLPRREPSFDATLTGPDGNANLVLVEKVIKGSVNLGTDPALTNGDQPGQYQETGTQYIFTYSAQGKPGQWTLAVMPRNTQSFEVQDLAWRGQSVTDPLPVHDSSRADGECLPSVNPRAEEYGGRSMSSRTGPGPTVGKAPGNAVWYMQ